VAEKLGFIGLGIMGTGMVRNLLKADFRVRVWNRTSSRMDEFLQNGAEAAENPKDLASRCDILFICVSDTPDVEEVILGKQGLLEGARSGSLVVDHSTIDPHTTRGLGRRLGEKGVAMLDAPISGGSEGAAHGTLSIMAGGLTQDFERALPYLKAMGKTITHVGGLGSGQMAKLVNQILAVGNAMAMSEALLFAQAGGLDLQKTWEAVAHGAAGSWMFSNRGPQILKRDWKPGFTIDLQQKDLRLVLATADRLGLPVLSTHMIFNLYRSLQARGLGGDGNHALIKALEQLSGIQVGGNSKPKA